MTPTLLAGLLILGLLTSALLGPWMLRSASPALVRVPRLATLLLPGGVVIWVGTFFAIGPVLAWVASGPSLLYGKAAEVCQGCLAAANPFSTPSQGTVIPSLLLLLLSAIAVVLLATGSGIILSSGALRELNHDELAAVLAHEDAHLRQRHHLITTLMAGFCRYLRWVPFISAAEAALPHYLEIAADDRARSHVGRPALVSALLKLCERTSTSPHVSTEIGVLHAAGPERIRQLVQPKTGSAGTLSAVGASAYIAALAVVSVAIHLPYGIAAVTGCA